MKRLKADGHRPSQPRQMRHVTALGLIAATLSVASLAWPQAAPRTPARAPAAAKGKAADSATAPAVLPEPDFSAKPAGAYSVLNQKGPGLPIVVATQPWPATVLGAPPQPAESSVVHQPTTTAGRAPTTAEEAALLQLQQEAEAYRKSATGYARAVGHIVKQRYLQKRNTRLTVLQENIDRDTSEVRRARMETMDRLKAFLAKYPDVAEHTPNAMFRLAALYEEQAIETDVDPGDAQYTVKLRAAFEPAERLYREVIARFPQYSQRSAVQFFLGALLSDTGRGPESQMVWRGLVCANKYPYPLPPATSPAEEKARASWKDGIPPIAQDHDNAYWDRWRDTHYGGPDPRAKAKGGKTPVAVEGTEDSYREVYPNDCVALPAPPAGPGGEQEPRFLAQTWWRIGEYHYSRGDDTAEEEGYFGASPYRFNRALSAYEHAVRTSNETVKVFSMYKIAWTYFKQQRYSAARQQFLRLLEYFDEKAQKGQGAGDQQMRQDAFDYIASSLTYLDMEGPGPDEPFMEREDIFGTYSGRELERKLEIAIDRVQDPKLVPQNRPWTANIYKALAAELESDEVQQTAIKAYELVIQKWPCDPDAPQYQNKIAQLYDMLAIKAESQADKDDYQSKALAARTKLLDYVGQSSRWVQCNKSNPDAIRAAEALMTEGVKNAAGRHTALGRVYISKARNYPEGSRDFLDNLAKAREEYRLAEKGWTAYLANDPDAADAYESNYWIADSRHKIVVTTHLMGEKLDPKLVTSARDAAVTVRDSNLDDKYLRYAAYFAVEVWDLLAEEGFNAYKKSDCSPGSGLEVIESPLDEPGDACRPESVRESREHRRIWVRGVPDVVVQQLRERDDYAARVPESADVDKNAPGFRVQVADTLYRYGRFEEATPRFERIWRENCGKNDAGFDAWYRLVIMSNLREDTQRSLYLVNEAKGAKSCALNEEQRLKERAFSEATSITALYKEADDAFMAAEKETNPALRAQKFREAAAKYEAALRIAPSRPEAPRGAMNAAYCYKQVNEYKKAADVYRFFLDRYGKEQDLVAYRDGDPKRGIKRDPEQFKTRLEYTKQALGELGRTYLQAFDYTGAARHYDEVANRTLLDDSERRDAAFNAVILQGNLGNRERMQAAHKQYLAFRPPAAERAEADFAVADFEYKLHRQNPSDAAQRLRALTALTGYYNSYRAQPVGAKFVVDAAYEIGTVRKAGNEVAFREWFKKTIDAFAAYKVQNKDAIGTREADMGAEAAYFFVNEEIENTWDPPATGQPRIRYEGDGNRVQKQLADDDKKRLRFIEQLEEINRTYVSTKWFPVALARQGTVDDTQRSALARAKVEVLDPTAKAKIAEIERKAQKTLDDPKASEEAKAQAQALLERADQIRQSTSNAWRELRKKYYDVLEPELVDRYTRAYLRAKQFNVKDPMVTRAVQRLAYYTDQLEDTKMRMFLVGVEKDMPPFKYRDQMFKQARPGSLSAPAPNVDAPPPTRPAPSPAPSAAGG